LRLALVTRTTERLEVSPVPEASRIPVVFGDVIDLERSDDLFALGALVPLLP